MNPPVPRRQIWSNAQGCRKSSSTTFHTKCAPQASLRKTRRVDVNIWSSKLLIIGERRENTKTIQDFTSRVWCSVCERTPPANPAFPMLDLCCWLAHGSALIGCTHEQLLAETVEERTARERATENTPSSAEFGRQSWHATASARSSLVLWISQARVDHTEQRHRNQRHHSKSTRRQRQSKELPLMQRVRSFNLRVSPMFFAQTSPFGSPLRLLRLFRQPTEPVIATDTDAHAEDGGGQRKRDHKDSGSLDSQRRSPCRRSATIDEAFGCIFRAAKQTARQTTDRTELDQEDEDLQAKLLKTKVSISTARRTPSYGPRPLKTTND